MTRSTVLLDEYQFLQNLVRDSRRGTNIIPILGAGISVASGIPAIPQIRSYLESCILLALRKGWTPEFGWPALNYFNENPQAEIGLEELHGSFAKRGFGATADWRKSLDFISRLQQLDKIGPPNSGTIDSFFQHVTSNKQPNLAHRMVANLAAIGKLDLILTTNFDELIEDAIDELQSIDYAKIVLHHNTELPPASTFENRNQQLTLLKLHGDRYGLRADDSLDLPASAAEQDRFVEYFFRFKEFEKERSRPSANLLLAGISLGERRLESLIERLRVSNGPNIYICCYSKSDLETAMAFEAKLDHGRSTPEYPQRIFIAQSRDFGLTLLRFYQMLTNSIPPQGVVTANQLNVPWPIIYESDWKATSPSRDDSREIERNEKDKAIPKAKIENSELRNHCDHRVFDMGEVISATTHNSNPYADLVFRQCREKLNNLMDTMAVCKEATLLSVFGTSQYQGLSALLGTLFYDRIDRSENCIWFDLDTAGSVDDFYEKLVECIVHRTATKKWWTPRLDWNDEERAKRLADFLKESSSRWMIVLNAREGAGINGPTVSMIDEEVQEENGWLDRKSDPQFPRRTDNLHCFLSLLDNIRRIRGQINATFVLVAHRDKSSSGGDRSGAQIESDSRLLYDSIRLRTPNGITLKASDDPNAFRGVEEAPLELETEIKTDDSKWQKSQIVVIESSSGLGDSNVEGAVAGASIIAKVLSWASVSPRRMQFMQALLLMSKPRFLVVPSGWAFRSGLSTETGLPKETPADRFYREPLWDSDKDFNVEDSLIELSKAGLVFLKPGGFIWLNSWARDGLRQAFELKCPEGIKARSEEWKTFNRSLRKFLRRTFDCSFRDPSPWINAWKAATHLGISRIYRRELQVTGEAISGIDAIRHCVESARSSLSCWKKLKRDIDEQSQIANQKGWPDLQAMKEQQADHAIQAINGARLLLSEYHERLIHQGIANCKCKRFSSILADIDSIVTDLVFDCKPKERLKKLHQGTKSAKQYRRTFEELLPLFASIVRFQRSLVSVMGKIAQETGFVQRAFKRQRQVRWYQYLEQILEHLTEAERVAYDDFLAFWTNFAGIEGLREVEDARPKSDEESNAVDNLSSQSLIAENHRKFATLHIAARSYVQAQCKLIEAIAGKAALENASEMFRSGFQIKDFRALIASAKEAFNSKSQLNDLTKKQIVKISIRQMQLSILIAKFCNSTIELVPEKEDSPDRRSLAKEDQTQDLSVDVLNELNTIALETGCVAYWKGVQAIEHQSAQEKDSSKSSLLAEMQKLETYSAAVKRLEGWRRFSSEGGLTNREDLELRFFNGAVRSLDNAESWLDLQDDSIPRAIILLERASLVLDFVPMDVAPIQRRTKNRSSAEETEIRTPATLSRFILHKLLSEPKHSSDNGLLDVIPREVKKWNSPSTDKKVFNDGMHQEQSNSLDKVEMAERLIESARNLIENHKQSTWWMGYADQLAIQAERLRLFFFLIEGEVPRKMLSQIGQNWPTDFENHMDRLHSRVFMDSMRYARCLHLFCDCALFVLSLRSNVDQVELFNKKIKVLFTKISEYRSYLEKISQAKETMEQDVRRGSRDPEGITDEITPHYVKLVDTRCERVLNLL